MAIFMPGTFLTVKQIAVLRFLLLLLLNPEVPTVQQACMLVVLLVIIGMFRVLIFIPLQAMLRLIFIIILFLT